MYHIIIWLVMFVQFLGILVLLSFFLWVIDGMHDSSANIDYMIRNYWGWYSFYTIFFFFCSFWWIRHSEAWWDALTERYGKPFDIDSKHFGFPTVPSIINVEESSNFVFVTATPGGIILKRPRRKKLYLSWDIVKKISIDSPEENNVTARLEVGDKESTPDKIELIWSDELTGWIPSSVNLIEIGKP